MASALPVVDRRDGGITALILGLFAMGWFSWGQAEASRELSAALSSGTAAALLVVVMAAVRTFHSPRTEGSERDPATGRRYATVVGVEFALIGAGAAVVGAAGADAYIPVWICAVVGLHFFPLATVLGAPAARWLGGVVTAVAAAALIAGVLSDVVPGSVTGAGAGLTLLVYAMVALLGPSPRAAATSTVARSADEVG